MIITVLRYYHLFFDELETFPFSFFGTFIFYSSYYIHFSLFLEASFYHYYNNKKMRCNLSYHHWVDLLYFLSLLLKEETMDLYTIFIYYSLFLTIRTLLKISYTIRSLFLLHYIHIIIYVNASCKSSLASQLRDDSYTKQYAVLGPVPRTVRRCYIFIWRIGVQLPQGLNRNQYIISCFLSFIGQQHSLMHQ